MASRAESLWRHPLVEGLAVLVGILIAFGLEAWWQDRSDEAAERTMLLALSSEVEDARAFFVSRDEALTADIDRADEIRRALSSEAALAIPDDSVNALAMGLGPISVVVPPRAALDDLISSGGIGRVRSARLRLAVAAYVQALESDRRAQDAAVDLWLTRVAPYRYSHSTLAVVSLPPLPDVPVSVDRDAYVGAREYINLLGARILRSRDVRTTHEAARLGAEKVLHELNALGINSAS
jgi:hypothetical protein